MSRRTRVKICGLTSGDDAELAVELGADAVGFVLWNGSPRAISPVEVGRITRRLPPFVTRVGVFVNASPEEVQRAAADAALDAAQLHGDADLTSFSGCGVRLIRSTNLASDAALGAVLAWPAEIWPIVDAHDPERHGGTGRLADWKRASKLAEGRRVILAGGLDAANVGRAIAEVHPFAVDVSSGVESAPGRKDPMKLKAFFAATASVEEAGA